jgi:hypothetical protein
MHRTQILFEEEQYVRLKVESDETGRSIGEIVREAVDRRFGTNERQRQAFRDSWGAWADRDDIGDGVEYVESLRQPLNERLKDLGWTE